jgi:hypothetical protein
MRYSKLMFMVTPCLLAPSVAAQPAAAQPAASAAQPARTAPSQSVLPNVLPTSVGATFDGRTDYTHWLDDDDSGPLNLFAFNLHGQYVSSIGLGGYLSLPIALETDRSDSQGAVGNLELGGLYVYRGGNVDAYARAGFAMEQTSTEDSMGRLVGLSNLGPRPADAVMAGADSSWLRGGAGVRLTSGALVVGGSGGIDVPIGSEDEDWGKLIHLSASVGFAHPRFGLAAGATMLRLFDAQSDDDDGGYGVQTVADVPVGGRARVYGAFGMLIPVAAFSAGVGLRISM